MHVLVRIRRRREVDILSVMSDPHAAPDRLVAVAVELGRLGRRLDELGAELFALRDAPPPTPAPVPAPVSPLPVAPGHLGLPAGTSVPAGPGPLPGPVPKPATGAGPWAGLPPLPPAPGVPRAGLPVGPPAARPAARRRSSLSGARLLAWTGGAVTLLGVVLLLALAASRGWFSAGARVGAGAVLGVGLVGLAVRLHRKETARNGAVAVAGTGIAALYLVVASATALYGFVPAVAGLALGLVVAAGGLGLADVWRSQPLAVGAVVGAALLAPVVTAGPVPVLVGLVVVLELVAAVVAVRRDWPWLLVVGGGWAALYGAVTAASVPRSGLPAAGAAAATVLVVGCAVALYALVRRSMPAALGVLGSAAVPLLVSAGRVGHGAGAAVAAAVAALMLGVAVFPRLGRPARIVGLMVGVVALFEATQLAFDGSTVTTLVLGEATVFVVVAAVLRSRMTLAVGAVYGALGVLAALTTELPLGALTAFPAHPFLRGVAAQYPALVVGAVVAVLVLAFAVALLVALGRTGGLEVGAPAWVPVGLVGLYGAAGTGVAAALIVSPDRTGFVVGHAVVTVSRTVLALVLLVRGISRTPLRVAGLVLVAAAVAKLVLFDLVSLDGLARVGAFLGAGLVLLAAGVRYARLVAEAERATGPQPTAGGEGPGPSAPC
jgi:uncharacterized membrane protein